MGSCCSSSSPTQEETTVGSSTQPSQQLVKAGSSQPSQQSVTAGSSTSSSSSQHSQQSPNAGPSSATKADLESFLQKFNDINQLHNLIQFIEELLKIASGENNGRGSSAVESSYIQDGQKILELLDKHIDKLPQKNDSIDGLRAETQKFLINFLEGAGKIHWVGAALSVVGFVLARYSKMSNNQKECLEILKVIVNLGKHVLKLNEQMPEEKEKLNVAVECIVVGCSMCASQLTSGKFFRFLTTSVNAATLRGFQDKIDGLYKDLTLSAIIEIQTRVPKLASPSQIAYKPAVGIERGLETVIQLLDLNLQHTSAKVVVICGFGGIGKTTLADAVYDHIDPKIYKKCRIHMDQNCTKNDLKVLQELILEKLFKQNMKLTDCDNGREKIWSVFKRNDNQPIFLYIDNGLRKNDLERLLPADLGSCLPPGSRLLVTTRNLQETDIFDFWNVQRQQYPVNPLPDTEARKILLKRATNYKDEHHINELLKLCVGVPLLLELAGAQLAISTTNRNTMLLELLQGGEEVEDVSDRIVDFVYHRLLQPVKDAFLDITSFFYIGPNAHLFEMDSIGDEEFRTLEEASFVKKSEHGSITIHDIIQARGKKISEQNRVTDPETLLACLKDEEKLRNLKGIFIRGEREEPPIEINADHLNCMSNSLRVLSYDKVSQMTFTGKCHKPFKQLRCLKIPSEVSDLPIEFQKLEHLAYYSGPFTKAMSLYELPPSLRVMSITFSAENVGTYSKIPHRNTSASSLVKLKCYGLEKMQMLPDGLEKLTKLEKLNLDGCHQLRELPSKFGELRNLKSLSLLHCNELKELPSDFGQLSSLKSLRLDKCTKLKELPSDFGELQNLKALYLSHCSGLKELPPGFGQFKNLEHLDLSHCSWLMELPFDFGQLEKLEKLDLSHCSGLKKLPPDFGQLKNLKELDLSHCSSLEEWPLSFKDLMGLKKINLAGCWKLEESLPYNINGKCSILID